MEPPAPPPVTLRQGQCFRHALPAGWQVVEDGPFAVSRVAPDQRAVMILVGNAGLPLAYPPPQFVYEKLAQTGLQIVRFGPPRPAPGVFGFPYAWDFDVDYTVGGVPCRGVARCSVAPSYDFCTMVMTWAASELAQWPSYAPWLPQLAAQVEVTSPSAFGAAGLAQQNLANAIALGEQARRDREHAAQQWAEVTAQRGASVDAQHDAFRQELGGVRRYENPYDRRTVDLPSGNAVYWVHAVTGQIVGDPSPTFDPRTPMDAAWQPMTPAAPPKR